MNPLHSRRDFFKLGMISAAGLTSLAFRPGYDFGELEDSDMLARVAVNPSTSVSVYSLPDDKSPIRYQRYRDEIVNIYYEVISDKDPKYNPLWYRVWGGYMHCAHVQRVHVKLNSPPSALAEGMHLIEVTVPYTLSYLHQKPEQWTPLYRLYYGTVYWVVGLIEGPDGEPWFRIKDDLLRFDNLDYFIPAKHARLIPIEEISPLSPEVHPDKKYIEVSLRDQELLAYEDGSLVLKTKISSGENYKPEGEIPWVTPSGRFVIQNKMPSTHMGYGLLTDDLEAYILPGVAWVSFFEPKTGVAFHGTHWHQNFGMTMSHGCINMKSEEAKWLYRWTTPVADFTDFSTIGYGTQVHVY